MIKDGIIIFYYVDDIVLAYRRTDQEKADEVATKLKEHYTLTGGHDLQWFLGIEVIRDRTKRLIWLSQASYIEKIVRYAETTPRCDTPMGTEELLPYKDIADWIRKRLYLVKVGSLIYIAVMTRPDIAFAVSRLARFNSNPGPKHHYTADRVLRYLYRTRHLALQFGGADDFEIASDASFADNSLDRKSSQAYIMKLFGGTIAWKANKQNTVTTSTTEAELLALCQCAKEAIYIGRLLKELTVRLDDHRIRIQCDNQQTIRLVTSEIALLKTQLRHVDIHNHWLRQEVTNGTIDVTYTPTESMMADGLTKALQGSRFAVFVAQVGLVDVTDQLEGRTLPVEDDLDGWIQNQVDQALGEL
jgi:hypothetical protein